MAKPLITYDYVGGRGRGVVRGKGISYGDSGFCDAGFAKERVAGG